MNKKIQKFRLIVQIAVLIFVSYVAFMHQYKGGGPGGAANIHSICPFGGIETIYKYVAGGEFIKKLNTSNIVVLVGTVLLTFFLGRYFCGWICAIGTMQEFFEKIGRKLKIKRITVPDKWDKILRYLKYVNLVGIAFFTWKAGDLIIHPYDPFAAYAHIPAGLADLFSEYLWGILILIISLLSSMVIPRFFCRYACPLGAFLGIINKISPFRIKRIESTCISCNKCNKDCPVEIPVATVDKVSSAECISCYNCVTACPTKKETLRTNFASKKMNLWLVSIAGLVIYFGTILSANFTGYWKQLPDDVTEAVGGNPNNIRGWMTLKQVSTEFNVPLREIYQNIGVSIDQLSPNTKIKEMEGVLKEQGVDFDHDEIGEIVKAILGERLKGVTEKEESSFTFRGNMTISSVAKDLGVPAKKIIKVSGLPEESDINKPIKEIASENRLEMMPIKEAIEALK